MAFLRRKQRLVHSLDAHEVLADSVSAFRARDHFDTKIERPIGTKAPFVFVVLIGVGLLYLGWHAASLELAEGAAFFAKSQENRFIVRPVFPPRGVIFDSLHKPFVQNIPSLGLVFEKNDFLQQGAKDIPALVNALADILHKDPLFFYDLGFPQDGAIKDLPPAIFIARDLSPEEVVSIASHFDELPGVKVFEGYQRSYIDPFSESHLIGFIGKVSAGDLDKNPELTNEEFVGKGGIEAFYDSVLRGKGGKKIVEINSAGKETRFKLTQDPVEGASLELTVDGDLQRVAYNLLQRYTEGRFGASIVILDPKNGAIRALVSYPGFDSNKFGLNLTQKEFTAITGNALHPLFNRAIGGEFPSGSVIKPMVAAAALEEKLIDPNKKIYDDGHIEVPNPYNPGQVSVFKDWRPQGWINFYDAIAFSANVYFYMVGGGFKDQKGLGIDKLKEYALRFGLAAKTGIDIPGEKSGFFPDPAAKASLEPNDPIWRIGDTYNTAIGQGGVKVTPLQMASLTSAVVNGGVLYRPRVLEKAVDPSGTTLQTNSPFIIRDHLVSKSSLDEVKKGMRETVTIGTAKRLGDLPVEVGAKTGTAQAGGGLPHAWVTAFAPLENPELVAVVMVEHAGEGSTVAVPILHDILEWYFTHRTPDGKDKTASSTEVSG